MLSENPEHLNENPLWTLNPEEFRSCYLERLKDWFLWLNPEETNKVCAIFNRNISRWMETKWINFPEAMKKKDTKSYLRFTKYYYKLKLIKYAQI